MTRRAVIVGRGRVGWAVHDNLAEHPEFAVDEPLGRHAPLATLAGEADIVLLAVSDPAIATVAGSIIPHRSTLFVHFAGALATEVLAPHRRRATLHPLAPIPADRALAARRLRGAWMAIAGDREVVDLAAALDGRTFEVDEARRVLYHAGATIAASHLAGLLGQVEAIAERLGVPAAAYFDLAGATLANVAEMGAAEALTGPIVRRDWATLRRHLDALEPGQRDAYRVLAAATAAMVGAALPHDLGR